MSNCFGSIETWFHFVLSAASNLPVAITGVLGFFIIVVCGEILFHLTFGALRLSTAIRCIVSAHEILKGILERILVSVGILVGVPTVVIAFAALKVATKLSFPVDDQNRQAVQSHNDYFIVGNVLSLLFALSYAYIAKKEGLISTGF